MMTTAAHTPGPWTISGDSGFAIASDTPEGRFLVGVCHHGPQRRLIDTQEIPADVAQANARLMAASPRLLAALKSLLPVAQAFEKQASRGAGGRRGGPVFAEARAAIAEAEGRALVAVGDLLP